MTSPSLLSPSNNRTYNFYFSSDVSSGVYFRSSLYVSVHPTLSLLGGTYLINGQSLYSYGSNFNISSGFGQTFTIPSGYKYLRIECTDAIIGEGWVSGSGFDYWYEIPDPITLTPPGNPVIVQNTVDRYTISWTASQGSGGSGNITYRVFSVTDGSFLSSASTNTSSTFQIYTHNYPLEYRIHAFYGGVEAVSGVTSYTFITPSITSQPAITSINPSSGKSTVISWSPATVVNQLGTTIYYQYFVGPLSTYSDTYHVGTTSSLSAEITENNIISKCGSGAKTVYLFVRAYWDSGSTQGGWESVSGRSFYYDPITLTPPGNPVVSQNGNTYVVSWESSSASGGTGNITYEVVVGDEGEIYKSGSSTSISIPISNSFYGKSVRFRVWAYYSGKSIACQSYVYFTAIDPVSQTSPGSPTIKQNADKITATWSAAIGQGGSGVVSYQLYYGNGISIGNSTTATSIIVNVPLYDTPVTFYVIGSYSGKTARSNSTTFTAHSPSLSPPGNPIIEQKSTNYFVQWLPATGSYGQGEITYTVIVGDEGEIFEAGTETSIYINIPNIWYDLSVRFRVWAHYSGKDVACADYVYFTATKPILTPPSNLTINNNVSFVGSTANLSWNPSTFQFASGEITYHISVSGTEIATTSSTNFTITEEQSKNWNTVIITVFATGAGYTSEHSNSVTFTYESESFTISYYDGSKWILCVAYYYSNSSWVECIPLFFVNSTWTECSH